MSCVVSNAAITCRHGYDLLVRAADPQTNATVVAYDPVTGQKASVLDRGVLALYTYNALTDANGNRTGWAYDALGQLLAKTYDDGTRVAYAYDAAGRLASRLDAKGGYATYQYDALGHLATNLFYAATNAPAPARTVVYAYDALGRLARCDDGVAVNTVSYDDAAFTRTVTADYADGHAMTSVYRYDPVAREMTCDFGGVTSVYRYDADGRLAAVSIPGEGWATYSYNALGQNDAVTLPGGTKRMLTYDAFGRLAAQSAQDGGGNALLAQAYQRSLTGRLETKTTDAGVWNYGYDLTDQVTNAVLSASASVDGAWGYAYDAMGNRKQSAVAVGSEAPDVTAYAANRLNQYSLISNHVNHVNPVQIHPTYDLIGNMTWDGTNAYFWDLQNQLILVSNAAVQVSNAYDAMGRRVRKEVYAYNSSTSNYEPVTTNLFYYDGWNLVMETVGSGSMQSAVTNRYVWGNDLSGSLQGAGGVGGLLAVSCDSSNTSYLLPLTYYPLFDHNGNVERYVARNGVVVATFQYDAFGNTVAETVNGEPGTLNLHFRFSTKYWDAEVGLNYYVYRYYSPTLGRWINRGMAEERGGINVYCMVRNSCIKYVDVFGLQPFSFAGDPNNPSGDGNPGDYIAFWGPKHVVYSMQWKLKYWENCCDPEPTEETYGPHYFYSTENYYNPWNIDTIDGEGYRLPGRSDLGHYSVGEGDKGALIIMMRWSRDVDGVLLPTGTTPLGWQDHGPTWNIHHHNPWSDRAIPIHQRNGGWLEIRATWDRCKKPPEEVRVSSTSSDGPIPNGPPRRLGRN